MSESEGDEGLSGEERGDHRVCMRCGKLMPSEAAFCHSCGADLRVAPTPGHGGSVRPEEFSGAGAFPAGAEPVPGVTTTWAGQYTQAGGAPPPIGAYPPYRAPYPGQPFAPVPMAYRPRKTDEMAIISLVCAVASFVILPFFPAVAAIALGFVSRQRIREAGGWLDGEGLALAGILVGILNVVFSLGLLVLVLVLASRV